MREIAAALFLVISVWTAYRLVSWVVDPIVYMQPNPTVSTLAALGLMATAICLAAISRRIG
jgi:hypothetical protein